MARRSRLDLTGVPQHLIQRGNNRQATFFAEDDYRRYLDWLAGAARAAGTVTKRLSRWLEEEGYLSQEAAGEATRTSAAAARDLPRAERAARILREAGGRLDAHVAGLAERDYREFDHFTIARVEPGRLWFEVREGGKVRECGPIPAPEAATRWLRPGWTVSCSLGRVRKTWRLLEVANVYPD